MTAARPLASSYVNIKRGEANKLGSIINVSPTVIPSSLLHKQIRGGRWALQLSRDYQGGMKMIVGWYFAKMEDVGWYVVVRGV